MSAHPRSLFRFLPLVAAATLLLACGEKEITLTGKTMGTTYTVRAVTDADPRVIKNHIDMRLARINASMSTYDKESEISRFNDMRETGRAFSISDDFLKVMVVARQLHRVTEGAWDGTIDPLVALWGFGRGGALRSRPPEPAEVRERLLDVGFEKILISEEGQLIKTRPSLSLDLASIAKGYGVDQVSELLEREGIHNYIVEIGGEVFASGHRLDGAHWRVGIATPRPAAAADAVYRSLPLKDMAMATSGDYRQFFDAGGRHYSHILDPRTGWPVENGVVSVSIIADNCTFADGLATAIMVMGADRGLGLIDDLDDVEGLIVIQQPDGSLLDLYSTGLLPPEGGGAPPPKAGG